ncbi:MULTISPECIES: ABC transporter ATP-binding protein [unclassified Fusibacter]|uniref:ABC transporter ATP-binding protein n=1 Tax=unclassified Fusibacter TaxID=2624464 RepID=UPI00101234D2|nr:MULTISPECIES: ABC transporter ATP-binding protein [unclassified Fusibacter]MCK8059195.1 ABC transporter ATP-binding protein [Fusibacter sp. A2]NPE22606.1 ABC transporter ATP-binding protein [Fusibacter sp. A1]RXV60706.1 ATP-binding cassette domain-containing protein [Fusibacter sp. A1]
MYLTIRELGFSYPKAKENVIKALDLDVNEGEIVALLGESGSGKSTLLRLIAGLDHPQKGSIHLDGTVLYSKSTIAPCETRGIGMVFQDYALFPHITVAKNIAFGMKQARASHKKQKVDQLLEMIHMTAFKNRYPHELSGGQQQRVALSRALAISPRLLLLDEPFSNLDAHLKDDLRREMAKLLKQSQITTVFVTHDPADCDAIADRVIKIDQGKIVENYVVNKDN